MWVLGSTPLGFGDLFSQHRDDLLGQRENLKHMLAKAVWSENKVYCPQYSALSCERDLLMLLFLGRFVEEETGAAKGHPYFNRYFPFTYSKDV